MVGNRKYYQVIEKRRWRDVRPEWAAYVPAFQTVGALPDPTLTDFFVVQQLNPQVPNERAVISGIREVALTEAIFLFQKSMHVARAVEVSASIGMLSWAVFQGYQSAYYAAKGFLALLGVCFAQPQGRQILLDLFPLQAKGRATAAIRDREVIFTSCAKLEQKLLWGFFGRLLRITEFAPHFNKHVGFLAELDHERIPRQRNRFIYHEDCWPLGDLIALRQVANFAFRGSFGADLAEINDEHPAFLAVLGMIVPSLLRLMFDELGADIPAITPHITYMDHNDWPAATSMVRSYF